VIGWLDCSAGISGDMMLGALVDAGVALDVLQEAVDAVGVEPVTLTAQPTTRGGIGCCKVDVAVSDSAATRSWSDVRALLEQAALLPEVRARALDVFARLATAEAAVHRVAADDVHFHEVGALDAVADVVGSAAGLHALGLSSLTASVVTVGSGTTRGAHGPLPVPPPAVLALLQGAPVQAGPVAKEMTTPTGAALLASTTTSYGPLPPMALLRSGSGAGRRDPQELANVLRLVLGDPLDAPPAPMLLLETNVDDLDPRLWPGVLQALLDAGANDAWLTPILMKKGRPAHTLSVLCDDAAAQPLRDLVFRETSTLGLRELRVGRSTLHREERTVDVSGRPVRVKVARLRGEVVNAMPEWEDVAAAAAALGRPAKQVLREAQAAAASSGGG
jgi:uncharacterized protein (TIGR00299 family) protein